MSEKITLKDIGRINIDVEKKIGTSLDGDVNIYLCQSDQIIMENKYGESYQKLLDQFRLILKKPSFVRVDDEGEDFTYLYCMFKNNNLVTYHLRFNKINSKFFLSTYGFIQNEEITILNKEKPFIKI